MPRSLVTSHSTFWFPSSCHKNSSLSATATSQTGNQKYLQFVVYQSVLALQY